MTAEQAALAVVVALLAVAVCCWATARRLDAALTWSGDRR